MKKTILEKKEWKRLYDIKYRERTKDRRKEVQKKYFEKNKEKIRVYLNDFQNDWRKTEKGTIAMRVCNQKRRKLVRETNDKTITRKSITELLELQNRECNLCKSKLSMKNAELDHIYPLSKGGLHTLKNVQWLCGSCNRKKHNKTG